MAGAIDLFIAYKFIKQLATSWVDWDAYKLGIIDDKGMKLRSRETPEERKAFPRWQILIANLKRILDKVPFGKSKLGSFAAALWLLKEELGVKDIEPMLFEFEKYVVHNKIFLIESNEDAQRINISRGRYKTKDGNVIFVKEDVEPFMVIFEEPVFAVTDKITGKEYTVIFEDLEPF